MPESALGLVPLDFDSESESSELFAIPLDCRSKYHGRASRDALRAWSCRASTAMHGPRHEPDRGPR